MPRVVYCICENEGHASEVFGQLKVAGFVNDEISALIPDKTGQWDFGHETRSKAPEGAVLGAVAGLLAGGCGGWMAGVGLFPVKAFLPLVQVGGLFAGLSVAAVAAVIGGILGGLFGLSKPEYEARRFAGKISGNILLSVYCEQPRAARIARRICAQNGAFRVRTGKPARARMHEHAGAGHDHRSVEGAAESGNDPMAQTSSLG